MLLFAVGAATLLLACHEFTAPIRSFFTPTALHHQNGTGPVVVYPGNMHGWSFYSDDAHVACADSTCTMVTGPAPSPMGNGSAELTTTSAAGRSLTIADYKGVRFADVTQLDYWTYRKNTTELAKAIKLQVDVDYDLTDAVVIASPRLNCEPSLGASAPVATWQHWDARTGASWWSPATSVVKGGISVSSPCVQSAPCTWTQLLAAFPNIGLHATSGALFLRAGPLWQGFRGNVDAFSIGILGATTTFDFEMKSYTPVSASAPDSGSRALWDSIIAPANILHDPPGLSGSYIRDLVYVKFLPTATQADRQAAIDAVQGTVVGGMNIGGPERFYAVRIAYVLLPGDGTSGPILRPRAAFMANPQVKLAIFAGMDAVVPYYLPPAKGRLQHTARGKLVWIPRTARLGDQSRLTLQWPGAEATAFLTPVADLDGDSAVRDLHIAEALGYQPQGVKTETVISRAIARARHGRDGL